MKLLTHTVMLDTLILAYLYFVTMLIELQKALSVCVVKLPVYWNEPYQKLWM